MFNWKILEIDGKDGVITHAKYHVTAVDEQNSVETEGFWKFGDPTAKIPFEQVTQDDVIDWIQKESVQFGENIIESRLKEQLDALKAAKVLPPWVPQVFSLGDK